MGRTNTVVKICIGSWSPNKIREWRTGGHSVKEIVQLGRSTFWQKEVFSYTETNTTKNTDGFVSPSSFRKICNSSRLIGIHIIYGDVVSTQFAGIPDVMYCLPKRSGHSEQLVELEQSEIDKMEEHCICLSEEDEENINHNYPEYVFNTERVLYCCW